MEFAIIVAIVAGLTQIFKSLDLPERCTPLFALVAGVLVTLAANGSATGLLVLSGIVAGLTAIGAYKVGTEGILGQELSEKLGISKKEEPSGTIEKL